MEAPPTVAALTALDADAWGIVVRLARPVLRNLHDAARTPALVRLTALPTSRLAGGAGRRRLAGAIADGGPLWVGLREALTDHPDVMTGLDEVVVHAPATVRASPRPSPDSNTRIRDLRDQVKQGRRACEEAERRLVAADARVVAAEAEQEAVAGARDRLQDQVDALRAQVEAAAEARRVAEGRAARRASSARADDREELRRLRRELDELRRERVVAAERRPGSPTASATSSADGPNGSNHGYGDGVAARPTLLPDVLRPSREIADLLVGPGRTVLIDGWNVSQRHRGHLTQVQQRQWLTDACHGLAVRQEADVDLYFDATDGPRPAGGATRRGRVRVVFPPSGTNVDDDIVLRIAAAPPHEPFTVVTDDVDLSSRVRAEQADVLATVELSWLLA